MGHATKNTSADRRIALSCRRFRRFGTSWTGLGCVPVFILAVLIGLAEGQSTGKTTGILCCEQRSTRLLLLDENADWNQPQAILGPGRQDSVPTFSPHIGRGSTH